MAWTPTLIVLCTSFIVLCTSFAVTVLVVRMLIPRLRLDMPNERSSHDVPIPRGGGVGILAGLVAGCGIGWLLGLRLPGIELFLGVAIVAVLGYLDDRGRRLPVVLRLSIQCIGAGVAIHAVGGFEKLPLPSPLDIDLGLLAIPLSVFWIVAVTNVYNFLDGVDGLAGMQGIVAGMGIAMIEPGGVMMATGIATTGACLGFLRFNWHPAKVFMGDVGSTTIGFILASLPLQAEPALKSKLVFLAALCLWFFLADGTFTLLRRVYRGENIFRAHNSHLYQRLARTGLRHDRVVLSVMSAAIAITLLAIAATRWNATTARWYVLAAAVIAFSIYGWWTRWRERYHGMQPIDQKSSA